MMFNNNYCTDFMFREVMVCVTCSPSILSLIIFNFFLVFKISQESDLSGYYIRLNTYHCLCLKE